MRYFLSTLKPGRSSATKTSSVIYHSQLFWPFFLLFSLLPSFSRRRLSHTLCTGSRPQNSLKMSTNI
ncbi:hypothetical protein AGABI1DRAFT_113949 [Agaricus bisporus var. burnettii JB137-S8]|uniref:Uncharacterized protein n=1 Tax=Agaricus bisporus var. burnettii (strain JB137-S8 / ATCC MYA-4627 / FGSC 10392) TaxID=597362 RepID=K5XW05_AGABU|nr:hypothetical protein AGABI2DRAFT_193786 [Agaricus bisporus var. bisporus H97]XP_007330061.1 uncharacterized protein AGABI1DRAFT_113949 [Agaricus bisporus var. burnettii JB137-S8]EKM79385.1 hypothetical protein AGABI1DRAFT_113949 [Agaricus bisporus var. burnettii JB137-S8]EKV45859.1 hypothetical protein AGABI2DRAFT_193786 [Agaricus bisporus var. bisporus H97]